MGTLVAKTYPTQVLAGLADHTYVECGTGAKGWSCWGGKTGGKMIGSGIGSTRRADAIAQPDEKGGITCYLINGVCHQAANRILYPAGLTVARARGYGLSLALFSMYGRPSGPLGSCKAPFDRHAGISGDLNACHDDPSRASLISSNGTDIKSDWDLAGKFLRLYDDPRLNEWWPDSRHAFQLAQFEILVVHRLAPPRKTLGKLLGTQHEFEEKRTDLEDSLAEQRMKHMEFLEQFNELTIWYQDAMARVLKIDEYYTKLFDVRWEERLVFGNPDAIPK